jgi:zinc and cadmium transporter
MRLTWIIAFSLLGSVGALSVAGMLIAFPKLHERLKTLLLAYAIGASLGAVFLGLLPEAVKEGQAQRVFLVTLAGILVFFLLEKLRMSARRSPSSAPGRASAHLYVT